MRTRRLPAILVALAILGASALASGCSSANHSLAVSEGAPLTLGDVEYNVVITRYLNPNDVEDRAYLQGAPKLPRGDNYLGVFMQIHNTGGSAATVPPGMKVIDTEGNQFDPAPLHNDFSLDLGSRVGAGAQVPGPESPAANGPIQGSVMLFLVNQAAVENRPLELMVPAAGETGEIQLDL
jgi:hypothetical protein